MQTFEIWMYEKQRTWEVYADLTEAVRAKLCHDGWTFVLRNQESEEIAVKRQPDHCDK